MQSLPKVCSRRTKLLMPPGIVGDSRNVDIPSGDVEAAQVSMAGAFTQDVRGYDSGEVLPQLPR